ncbi:MAG: hypothetical protein ACK5AB_02250 [Bacteroidota bacterium]|jgi:hypothetical protein
MENFLKGRLNVNIDTFVAQMKTWVLILTGVFFLHTALVAQENSSSAGFFKSAFQQQSSEGKSFSADCSNYGYFKSNTGWRDGKYYLLINEVLPGTIVKIQLQSSERIVYAKVLGPLTPAKENDGLMLRMSAASLAALGIKDNNERVLLTWNK